MKYLYKIIQSAVQYLLIFWVVVWLDTNETNATAAVLTVLKACVAGLAWALHQLALALKV